MRSIALDVMGGDFAPCEVIKGAKSTLENEDIKLYLVGQEQQIKECLEKVGFKHYEKIEIVDAPEVVTMKDTIISYLRGKKKSSIKIALELVKNKIAEGMFSAGNTGAVMVNAKFILDQIEGIKRSALAVVFPTQKGESIILDVGANADCKPEHLLQFAIMGTIFSEEILGKTNPTVGLMSIGEETIKGNKLTKEAFKLLSDSELNFKGNVEGHVIHQGVVDIIVTDGFTGNVALKVAEGMAENLYGHFKNTLTRNILHKIGLLLLWSGLRKLKKKLDYSEYGGAILLGVKGVVVIGHGRSRVKAIKNGLLTTKKMIESQVDIKIAEKLKEVNFG